MGVSVIAYWPGITEKQLESQPGFSTTAIPGEASWQSERVSRKFSMR
jgi:hypothetical protein